LSWRWILREIVLAIHDEQLAEHGGESGIRSDALLDSALDRPKNKAHYARPSLAELAAAYAFGPVKNHPFLDGNKRTAAVVSELFLHFHNAELTATDEQVVHMIEALAAGRISEKELVSFFEAHCKSIND
jgi:death on curing protein